MTVVNHSPGATGTGTGDDAARLTSVDSVELDRVDPVEGAPVEEAPVDAVDLVAQIRQLAGCDPADVRRVVGDVLDALDRVAGGRLREQLPPDIRADIRSDFGGGEGGRTADPG